jgi:hypothetical protein
MTQRGLWAVGFFFPGEGGNSVRQEDDQNMVISRCAGCPRLFPEVVCPRRECRFERELKEAPIWGGR